MPCQHGAEIEVTVRDMRRDDAIWGEMSAIDGEGFGGQQVNRNGIAGEGVENQHVVLLTFAPFECEPGVTGDKPDFGAAAVFYVLYVAGIIVFVVAPARDGSTRTHAALRGALFGFFCYMTYDLTNMATLKGWPLQLAVVDILWGMFITAASALAGHLAAKATAKSTT